MTRKILVLALAIAAASAVATVAFARHTMAPTLVGTDGPGYKIMLTKSGQTVKTLKHGTYTFVSVTASLTPRHRGSVWTC